MGKPGIKVVPTVFFQKVSGKANITFSGLCNFLKREKLIKNKLSEGKILSEQEFNLAVKRSIIYFNAPKVISKATGISERKVIAWEANDIISRFNPNEAIRFIKTYSPIETIANKLGTSTQTILTFIKEKYGNSLKEGKSVPFFIKKGQYFFTKPQVKEVIDFFQNDRALKPGAKRLKGNSGNKSSPLFSSIRMKFPLNILPSYFLHELITKKILTDKTTLNELKLFNSHKPALLFATDFKDFLRDSPNKVLLNNKAVLSLLTEKALVDLANKTGIVSKLFSNAEGPVKFIGKLPLIDNRVLYLMRTELYNQITIIRHGGNK